MEEALRVPPRLLSVIALAGSLWRLIMIQGCRDDMCWIVRWFVRGNQEQQMYLIEMLKHFISPWSGAIPKRKARHGCKASKGDAKGKKCKSE